MAAGRERQVAAGGCRPCGPHHRRHAGVVATQRQAQHRQAGQESETLAAVQSWQRSWLLLCSQSWRQDTAGIHQSLTLAGRTQLQDHACHGRRATV